jgi:hypothetical protein
MLASSQSTETLSLEQRQAAIERCAREHRQVLAMQDKPAWVTVLTWHDWEMEKQLILVGRIPADRSRAGRPEAKL